MGINEDIVSLRERMTGAMEKDLFDDKTGGFVQTSLIQIMKEAERKRQTCAKQAEHFRTQAVNAEGQAAAYATISSVVNAVFQSMLNAEERAEAEEKAFAADREEEKADKEAVKASTSKKKTTKRTTRKTRTKKSE